ncbi:hypothetical protein EGY31_06105 [Burkholderia multivorans]|nr:hypothetical protein EGY31_06105 [Burkholderia multivorans]
MDKNKVVAVCEVNLWSLPVVVDRQMRNPHEFMKLRAAQKSCRWASVAKTLDFDTPAERFHQFVASTG